MNSKELFCSVANLLELHYDAYWQWVEKMELGLSNVPDATYSDAECVLIGVVRNLIRENK